MTWKPLIERRFKSISPGSKFEVSRNAKTCDKFNKTLSKYYNFAIY